MNKKAIETRLKSAFLWFEEARECGGDAIRHYKKALNKAKREATEVGIDVEACIAQAKCEKRRAAKKSLPCDLLE